MATSPILRNTSATPEAIPLQDLPAAGASSASTPAAAPAPAHASGLLSVAAARRGPRSSRDSASGGPKATRASESRRGSIGLRSARESMESRGPSLRRSYATAPERSSVSGASDAPPTDAEGAAPASADHSTAVRLNASHGHYVVETRYRPVDLQEQQAFFNERDKQLKVPIPLDRGHWVTNALGLTQAPARRDMAQAHDHHLRSLNFDPGAAVASYARAGSANATVGMLSDATAMAVTALSATYGDTTGKAVGFFLAQLGATMAAQGVLAYVRLYTLMLSELQSSQGYTARSKTIKSAMPSADAMAALQRSIQEAKHLGAHAIRTDFDPDELSPEQAGVDLGRLREPPLESDIRALEDSKTRLEKAILDHYIPSQDDDSYFRAKTRQSNVQLARSAVAAFASNIVRQARPQDCNLGGWALLTTGLILLAARVVQIAWAARRDEADKRTHSHKLTLEVTPLQRPEPGKLAEGYAQTYLSQSAIRMTHVDSILGKKESQLLGDMAAILGVQEHHMLAYERAGGLQEILRRATPLTADESRELEAFRALDTGDNADISREDILRWVALEHQAHTGLGNDDMKLMKSLGKRVRTHNLSGGDWQRFAIHQALQDKLASRLSTGAEPDPQEQARLQRFRGLSAAELGRLTSDEAVDYAALEIRSELAGGPSGEAHRNQVVDRLAQVQTDSPIKALYDQARDDRLGELAPGGAETGPRMQIGSRTIPRDRYATLTDQDLKDHLLPDRAADSLRPREHAQLLALQARRGGYEMPESGTDRVLSTKVDTRLRELANSNLSTHGDEVRQKMAKLREAAGQLVALRVDQAMLKSDWNKLSDTSRDLVKQYYIDGRSPAKLALSTFAARATSFGGMMPGLWSGVGGALHLAILGSQAPVAVQSFFKIFGERFPQLTECVTGSGLTPEALGYSKVRFAAQAMLLLPQVATSRQGVPGVLNKDIRRARDPRLVPEGENLPTVAETALRFAPRALVTMYYQQLKVRWAQAPALERSAGRVLDQIDATLQRLRAHAAASGAASPVMAPIGQPTVALTRPSNVDSQAPSTYLTPLGSPRVDKGKQRETPIHSLDLGQASNHPERTTP